jgi:hypothetical protein
MNFHVKQPPPRILIAMVEQVFQQTCGPTMCVIQEHEVFSRWNLYNKVQQKINLKEYLNQGRNLPQLCNINDVDLLALPLDAWFKLWTLLKHTIINIISRYQLHLPLCKLFDKNNMETSCNFYMHTILNCCLHYHLHLHQDFLAKWKIFQCFAFISSPPQVAHLHFDTYLKYAILHH